MAKIEWDKTGERYFEAGVDHGVLYVYDPAATGDTHYVNGVAWNGLVSVNESPEGGEPTPLWADNMKYLNLMSAEDFKATIECYTYPPEFSVCDGEKELTPGVYVGQQDRAMFGLCYRTKIGNDEKGTDKGYKLHLIYGCLASPASKEHNTINDNPEADTFSWDISTTPVPVTIGSGDDAVEFKPTAHITIDSRNFTTTAEAAKLTALEAILYGGDSTTAALPMPETIYNTIH